MPAKVSIIMPVKNVANYIADSIESIQKQSFNDWELIIINDRSTDETPNIIKGLQQRDPRIQVFLNQGKGIIPALKLALDKTQGKYITRFDGDDLMPEGRLEAMVSELDRAPDKTIATGKVKYFSAQPISPGYQKYEAWLNTRIDQADHWKWIYRECVIASPNWMMTRKELVETHVFDAMTYPEDYYLVLHWYTLGFQVRCLQTVTLLWREHPMRTSRNSDHYNQEHFFRLKIKHFIEHELQGSELVLWGTESKGKLTAKILDQLGVPFEWMGLTLEPQPIGDHPKVHYTAIEELKDIKLLVAIYPPEPQRVQMESYLHQINLRQGREYWYL